MLYIKLFNEKKIQVNLRRSVPLSSVIAIGSNRNLHQIFRLTALAMTLDDLDRSF